MLKPIYLLVVLISLVMPALIQATPTAMRLVASLPRTDVVNVGVNGISEHSENGGGAGTLSVAGLSGNVSKAWLYWKGIEFVNAQSGWTALGSGSYDEPEIRFDNQLITGSLVASIGAVDCHPNGPNVPDSGAFYRADVTASVKARGNGSYAFSGMSDGLDADLSDGAAHSANGLSLVIYFDDGNSANDRRVDHYEGQVSDTEGQWNLTFPLDYIGGAVEVILHVSDGQSIFSDGAARFIARPGRSPGIAEILQFNGSFADGLGKYQGLSVPAMGVGRTQGLWDIRRVPITTLFGRATRYTTELGQDHAADCVSLQIAQVLSAPTPEAPMLAPGAHDFGEVLLQTQSASQIFTVTNLWPYPIEFPTGVAWTTSSWYRIVTQNCTGQALAPGGTCSIEIACTAPVGDGGASAAPLSALGPAWRQVAPNTSISGSLYAKLNCSGVPSRAFSRLEFLPRGCFLNDTAVNTSVTLPALVVRNTGSLPITIASTGIQHTVGSGFTLPSTTCTVGRVLAPNDTCEMRALFRAASVPTTTRASAFINYRASDANGQRFVTLDLEARSIAAVPSDGETLFQNGFEFGLAQCLE